MEIRIKLNKTSPEIYGLEQNERPMHLLADDEELLYLATSIGIFEHRLFVGKRDSPFSAVDKIVRFETYRDGGTTEIDFILNSKEGRIYVPPSPFKQGALPQLDFDGITRNLTAVCDYPAYLFNAYHRNENNVWVRNCPC